MGTTTKLTFEDFQKLPEREGAIYELDEGELFRTRPTLHKLITRNAIIDLAKGFEETPGD